MEIGFAEGLTTIGLLLVATAALSGLIRRSVLSLAVLSLGAGLALEATGILSVEPGATALLLVIEVVLIVVLFSDGLLVEQEFLREHWHAPARALVVAMPVNAAFLALAAKLLFGELSWSEAFLLGFVLSPTDPVITSSVVSSPAVPAPVRGTLNLESGLNDGLALPFVVLFLEASTAQDGLPTDAIGSAGAETLIGLSVGAALAYAAGALYGRLPEWALERRFEGAYALGLGLAAYGVADLAHGNGLIAAFSSGLVLAVVRHEAPDVFHHFNESLSSVLQVVAFALFGALVLETGFELHTLAAVGFVLFALVVARPASVLLAFVGVRMSRPEKLFIAWFGPKGIASMLFALFVLNSGDPNRTLVFDLASLTILASIVAHGLTDTLGARWVERRIGRAQGA